MNRLRLAALSATSVVLVTAGLASAGSDQPLTPVAPQVTDAAGDSLGPAGTDILSAGLSTTGVVDEVTTTTYTTVTSTAYKTVKVKKGKKTTTKKVAYTVTTKVPHTVVTKTYTPDTLVAKMTLDAAPSGTLGSQLWSFAFTYGKDCSAFYSYSPGLLLNTATGAPDGLATFDCGDDPSGLNASFVDITPVIKGGVLEWDIPLSKIPSLPVGTTLSGLEAQTGVQDPVGGFSTTQMQQVFDDATTAGASYTIS